MSNHISNLRAENMGDGEHIKIYWTVAEPHKIRHFTLERYDRHLRKWVPYDGFRGVISANVENSFERPSYQVVAKVDDSVSTSQSFRIKTVFKDGTSSEWATASDELQLIAGGTEGDITSRSYYIKSGLEVSQSGNLMIEVQPGSAVLAGQTRTITSPVRQEVPEKNTRYIAYIDSSGIVGISKVSSDQNFRDLQTSMYVSDAIRLANIVVDTDGKITIKDTRWLWPPGNFSVSHDEISDRLHVLLEWNEVLEPNTYKYKIYRGSGDSLEQVSFYPLEAVSSQAYSLKTDQFPETLVFEYENADNTLARGITFWYKIATIDQSGKESLAGSPQSIYFEMSNRPEPPYNLRGSWDMYPGSALCYVDLSWDQDGEDEVEGYKIYIQRGDFWDYQATIKNQKTWRHSWIPNGSEFTYAVKSFNKDYIESHLSAPVTIQVGDTMPPAIPEWDDFQPIKTGGDEHLVWVDLKWKDVVTNADGSALTDLKGYNIYQIRDIDGQKKYSLVKEIRDPNLIPEARIEYREFMRDQELTFVITAIDFLNNESERSLEKSITLGGARPSAPEFTVEYINEYGNDKISIKIEDVTTDEDGEPLSDRDIAITKYLINRSRLSTPRSLYDTVIYDPDEAIDGITEYIDTNILKGQTFYYTVFAVDSNGGVSAEQESKGVRVGDYIPPRAPGLIDFGTRIVDGRIENYLEFLMPTDSDIKGAYIYASIARGNPREIGYVYAEEDEREHTFIHSDDIKNGVEYQYFLVGLDFSNNITSQEHWESTDIFIAGDTTPPEKPLVALESLWENNQSGVKISWDALESADIEKYEIYRSDVTSSGPFRLIDSVENTGELSRFVYKDLGLTNKGFYWYKVLSVNTIGVKSDGCEYEDGSRVMAGDTSILDAPHLVEKNIEFRDKSIATTTFSWSSNEPEIDFYKIYFSYNKDFGYSLISQTDDTSFHHDVIYGRNAYYRIVLVSPSGNESEPLAVEFNVVNDEAPERVKNIGFEPIEVSGGHFQARIFWDYEYTELFKAFKVYSISTQGHLSLVATISDQEIKEYLTSQLRKEKQYSFIVSCVNIYDIENLADPIELIVEFEDLVRPAPIQDITALGKELGIVISWKAPKVNEDGTPLLDFAGYRLYYSTDPIDPSASTSELELLADVVSNSYFHQVAKENTYYYAVEVYDLSDNFSDLVVTDFPASSSGISEELLDPTPPPTPDTPILEDSGVIQSTVDDSGIAYASISWTQVLDSKLSHYNIYLNGQYFSQTNNNAYTLYGLTTGIENSVKISSVSKISSESELSGELVIPSISSAIQPPAPIPLSVNQYTGGLIVIWDEAENEDGSLATQIQKYELQYAETDGERPSIYNDGVWNSLSSARSTYHFHGRLNYDKYYYYRIRTIDQYNVQSSWVSFESVGDGLRPAKTGASDLAYQSVYTENLIANIIKGTHIDTESLESRHFRSNIITGDHIVGESILGRHLRVEVGGRNLLSNSAFGLEDRETGELGIGWSIQDEDYCYIIDKQIDPEIPILDYALEFSSLSYITTQVVQQLNTKSKTISISFDARTELIYDSGSNNGFIIDLCTEDQGSFVRLSSEYLRIVGSTIDGWTRMKKVFYLPEYENIYFRAMIRNSYGLARITNILVEEGDLSSQWSPKPGETYGANGSVQINPSGIIVKDGNLNIVTNEKNGRAVVINHEGILAGDKSGSYAKMSSDGFTSFGGAFSVYTKGSDGANNSISFDSSGITAYGEGFKTFELLSSNGSLSIWGGNFILYDEGSSGSSLILDKDGIRLTKESQNTFNLDPEGLTLSGDFTIKSGPTPETSGGFIFTEDSLKTYYGEGSDKKITFLLDASTGDIAMGSTLVLSSSGIDRYGNPLSSDGNSLVISTKQRGNQLPGIYGSGSSGSFKILSDGRAEFSNGSITIHDDSSEITLDQDGLRGKGFNLSSTGLVVTNASITSGNIIMDELGMTLGGSQALDGTGITVMSSSDKEIIKINEHGIKVFHEAGIHIDGGSITFGDGSNTAIDNQGINADAIKAGTLKIVGENGPKISVGDDDVLIDQDGVTIYGGKLKVFGPSGSALIKDGKISASALEISFPGTNILRNGTGAFRSEDNIPDFWEATRIEIKTTDSIAEIGSGTVTHSAGISSNYGIRAYSQDSGWRISQRIYKRTLFEGEAREFCPFVPGKVYTAKINILIIHGKISASISEALEVDKDGHGNDVALDRIVFDGANHQWIEKIVSFRFNESEGFKEIYFTPEGSSANGWLFYITDIMILEGSVPSGFVKHESEVLADGLVSIRDGAFTILSQDGEVRLDRTGLSGPNFKLTDDGFELDYSKENHMTLDKHGLRVVNGDRNVFIDSRGITTNGMFNLTSSENGGYMEISGERILIKDSLNDSKKEISITPHDGILAIGSNAFVIKSSHEHNTDGVSLTSESLTITTKNRDGGDPFKTVIIGKFPEGTLSEEDSQVTINRGLYVSGGNFYLETERDLVSGEPSMRIAPGSIEITHKKNEREFQTILNSEGLLFKMDGAVYNYVKNVYISKVPVLADGSRYNFTPFLEDPTVVVLPANVRTYTSSNVSSNQRMKLLATSVSTDSFVPEVSLVLDGSPSPDYILHEGGEGFTQSGRRINFTSSNSNIIVETTERASSMRITMQWKVRKAALGLSAGFVKAWVSFSYHDGTSWSDWGPEEYMYEVGGGWFGRSKTGSRIFSSKLKTAAGGSGNVEAEKRKIRAKIRANVNKGNRLTENSLEVISIISDIVSTIVDPSAEVYFICADSSSLSPTDL